MLMQRDSWPIFRCSLLSRLSATIAKPTAKAASLLLSIRFDFVPRVTATLTLISPSLLYPFFSFFFFTRVEFLAPRMPFLSDLPFANGRKRNTKGNSSFFYLSFSTASFMEIRNLIFQQLPIDNSIDEINVGIILNFSYGL